MNTEITPSGLYARPGTQTLRKTAAWAAIVATGALLLACGGGTDSAARVAPAPAQPTPAPTTVHNPLSGIAAVGNPVSAIHGTAAAGATVTAYPMLPDGSSGAALGTAVVAGSGGEFELRLNAPAGNWIRIVARGGKYQRTVDNTFHPIESMELVTPFVTTNFDYFVLTPVTDVAARIMAKRASSGEPLVDAFKTAMRTMLQLDMANLPLQEDVTVYQNMLKNVVVSDLGYHRAQTLNGIMVQVGIDRLGVLLDLPSAEVWRALAAAGERGFAIGAVDGSGNPIMVGTWSDGSYSTTQRIGLQELMNAKAMDEIKVTDVTTGVKVAPSIKELVSRYMIVDFFLEGACADPNNRTGTLRDRYPYLLNEFDRVDDATCIAVRRRVADFIDRQISNHTGRWK